MRTFLPSFAVRMSGFCLLFALGCSHGPEPRGQPLAPPPDAWLQVALEVTGPAADNDKYDRCVKTGYEMGVAVNPQAPVKAVLTLADSGAGGNRITIVPAGPPGTPPVRDEARPQWSMASLCADAFATAADFAGHQVEISRSEPGPPCEPRGMVEGSAGGGWFAMPSYEAALGIMKLRAARAGMNYVVVDAMRQVGAQLLTLNGRGFVCPQGGLGVLGGVGEGQVAPQGPACVPDCSPGYTCVGGKCVSACNPPCTGGQRCGPDRICH
jgi:hypothetical protein